MYYSGSKKKKKNKKRFNDNEIFILLRDVREFENLFY